MKVKSKKLSGHRSDNRLHLEVETERVYSWIAIGNAERKCKMNWRLETKYEDESNFGSVDAFGLEIMWKNAVTEGCFSPEIKLHFHSLRSLESCCLKSSVSTLWETMCISRNPHHGEEMNSSVLKAEMKVEAQQKVPESSNWCRNPYQVGAWNFRVLLSPPNSTAYLFSAHLAAWKAIQPGICMAISKTPCRTAQSVRSVLEVLQVCVSVVWVLLSTEGCLAMNNAGKAVDMMEIFWQVYMTKHTMLSKRLLPMRKL